MVITIVTVYVLLTFFVGDYAGDKYGIPSRLWEYGGKSNQGFCNDDFGIDVFTDKLNDSRYQKNFPFRNM